jgi:hypothetical protein
MHLALPRSARPWAFTALAAAVLTLTACGGDSSSTPATPQSLSGVVIDGPLQGATVCLDLNKNGSCDSGEPTSSTTDASGAYTITGLTAEQVSSGAPLIAVIPATAVDTSTGATVGTAYTLQAPAGKPSVISPITNMVQAGIAQGLTQAQSEAAVAAQLQVNATNLYNNYVASSSGDNATLATAVPTIVASLQAGEPVVVAPPAASSAGYWVRLFDFTDIHNYTLRYYYSTNQPDSHGLYTFYDKHTGLNGGIVTADDPIQIATASGWKTFDGTVPNTSSGGSPNASTWAYGNTYTSTRVDTDVSTQSIASVIQQVQDTSAGKNTLSTMLGVNVSSLTGTMPAGAKIRKITSTPTATLVGYRESDGTVTFNGAPVTTLDALIADFPVPTTPRSSNTVSMGNLHSNNSCVPASGNLCSQERVRVAFGSANTATYYLCDVDKVTNAQSNCTAQGSGTYAKGTAIDGVTPILTFAGLPSSITSVQTYVRVFVERNNLIYYGFKDVEGKASVQIRLNKVAFEPVAAQLGITPPTVSGYAGSWTASYAGGDTGSCSTITISMSGSLTGNCTSTGLGGSFTVSGTVASDGSASFTASGGTSSGATFSGTLGSTSGTGAWARSPLTGTWTATKS